MADWFRLDNAALIFPVVRRRDWSNAFRVSSTLSEDVDPEVLQQAVNALMPRFPSIYVSLHKGFFWYYLQKLKKPPVIRQDKASPLIHMTKKELRRCCFRVLYYRNRLSVEIFHSLTDGTGGLSFLKTLTAEYIALKYGVEIPAGCGVLDVRDKPTASELEDSFVRSAISSLLGWFPVSASRSISA